jgi:GNAT superfamily N-acetyltransferase
MEKQIIIEFLHDHHHLIPTLVRHFKAEWNEHYGPGGPGDARIDIESLCNRSELPIGLIALKDKIFCGTVALRSQTTSHQHLSPWLTGLFVVPEMRRQGVGTVLVNSVEHLSKTLGYLAIYARSLAAITFFHKNNWIPFDEIPFGWDQLTIFRKELRAAENKICPILLVF